MKKKKLLKPTAMNVLLVLLIIITTAFLFLTANSVKIPTYTDEFWNLLKDLKIYSMSTEFLDEYENEIKEEITQMHRRYDMQKAYFALGYIEGIKGNHEESNNFYFQAISINPDASSDFLGQVYKELSVNSLALYEFEKAEAYLHQALQFAKSDDLKVRIYQRYAQGVLRYHHEYNQIVDLLENIDQLDQDYSHEIEKYLFYSDICVMLGYYPLGIQYLLTSLELSIENDDVRGQQEIGLKLSHLYYLTENYEYVIDLLNSNILSFEQQQIIHYLKPIVYSIYFQSGYEIAANFLEQTYCQMIINPIESQEWVELYFLILRSDLAIHTGELTIGREYLKEAYSLSESVEDRGLFLWIEKVYLDSLLLEGMKGEKIVLKYVNLYHEVEDSNLYYYTKIDLLNEIASSNMKLGNYVLAYEVFDDRQNKFNSINNIEEYIDLDQIYEQTKFDLKVNKYRVMVERVAIIIAVLGSAGTIVYLSYKNHRQVKLLTTTVQSIQSLETLTQTLTKEALYKCLMSYISQGNEFTFIVLQFDQFKRYNEVYGYLSGDEALKTLSKHLKEVFKNDYISRHLGNYFIIASYHTKEACVPNLMLLMQQIYDLNIENSTDLKTNRLTISAGICSGVIQSEQSIDQHIQVATKNLEHSQLRGNNKFTCS